MEKEPLLDSHYGEESESIQKQYLSDDEEIDAIVSESGGQGLTCNLIFAIASCILGSSFMFGYNTGVLNAPESVIEKFYNDSRYDRTGDGFSDSTMTFLWAVTLSIYCVGGMIGGLSAGYLADKFGRKGVMLRNSFITIAAAALFYFSKMTKSYEMLICGRFVAGVAAGIYTGAAPLYLSEIAPTRLRGFAGVFNQLAITFGILVSNIFGLKILLGTADLWQYLLLLTAVPAVIHLVTLPCCPETPRYYMICKNNEEEAEKALKWLRGNLDVSDEIEEMKNEIDMQQREEEFKFTDLFKKKELLSPLIISLIMQLSQQFSGINAVIYYSTNIFMSASLSEQNAQYATLGTSAVNVVMTFISAIIMDRAGRRTLHLFGLGGLFIFSLILSISQILQPKFPWLTYVCIAAVVFYIIFFACGPGSIPWFIVAELFSQNSRPAAMSLAVLVNWMANFTVGLVFPELQKSIGNYSFIPFVVLLAIFWLFTYWKVPETKGKTIEQITAMFVEDPDAPSVEYKRLINETP